MQAGPTVAGSDLPLKIDRAELEEFCRRWKVRTLEVFGSVLRPDFHQGSDVDVLVSFGPDADWSLFDHVEMTEALSALLGRRVDLVSRRAIERSSNWIRRSEILESAQPLYVA